MLSVEKAFLASAIILFICNCCVDSKPEVGAGDRRPIAGLRRVCLSSVECALELGDLPLGLVFRDAVFFLH
jgi:hypothetical protein